MTRITDIKSLSDLIAFYQERDINHDGRLDLTEAKDLAAPDFDEIDTNHDKLLAPAEIARRRLAPDILADLEAQDSLGRTFPDITLSASATIKGNQYPAGTRIEFRRNGTFYKVTLGTNAVIGDRYYKARSQLILSQDGRVILAWGPSALPAPATGLANIPPDFGPEVLARRARLGNDQATDRWIEGVLWHIRDAGPTAGSVAKAWYGVFGAFRDLNIRYEGAAGTSFFTGPMVLAGLVEPPQFLVQRTGDCRAASLLISAALSALGANGAIVVTPQHAIGGLVSSLSQDGGLVGVPMPWTGKNGPRLYFYPIDGTKVESDSSAADIFRESKRDIAAAFGNFATTMALTSGQVVWVDAAPNEMNLAKAAYANHRGRYMLEAATLGLLPDTPK